MAEHGEREHVEHEHGNEPIEEFADEAVEDNPVDQTRREGRYPPSCKGR